MSKKAVVVAMPRGSIELWDTAAAETLCRYCLPLLRRGSIINRVKRTLRRNLRVCCCIRLEEVHDECKTRK